MKSGVILAGGKSTRMGIDKCTVLFCGKPLIYWPYAVLKDVADEVILSVSIYGEKLPYKIFFGGEIEVVRDEKPNLGPLSGMLSSFKEAKGEYVALAPCDSPLIKTELYMKLFEMAKGSDGAVPVVNGYWEPLHGVYKRETMIKAIEKVLSEGKSRPIDTYEYLNIRKLTQDKIKDFDSKLLSFININSFQDLAKASGMLIMSRNTKSP